MFVWYSERVRTSSSSRTSKSLDSWSNQRRKEGGKVEGKKEGRKKERKEGRKEGRKTRNGGERNRKGRREEGQNKLRKEEVTDSNIRDLTRTVHSLQHEIHKSNQIKLNQRK